MTHEEFERIVMEKLLEGNDRLFSMLKKQYEHSAVASREFTGCGFFTTFSVPAPFVEYSANGKIDDVVAKFPDEEAYYFILYIKDGKIDVLEGFSTLNDWKCNYEEAEVSHCFENRREFEIK